MKRLTVLATLAMLSLLTAIAFTSSDAAETGQTWRLTELLDQPVMNMQDKELGEIEDLVIRRNGKVKNAIISLGGPLSLSDAETDVRFRALQLGPQGSIRLDATAEALENKPRFNYRQRELFTGFYSLPIPPVFRRGSQRRPEHRYDPYLDQGAAPDQKFYPGYPGPYYPNFYRPWYGLGGYHPMNWTYFPERMLGSSVLDRPLLNKYGDTVGNLKDLIIDSTNKVTKLIISTGEFLGIDGREVAIPFRPLGFSFEGVEYDITAEQLASMPAYGK